MNTETQTEVSVHEHYQAKWYDGGYYSEPNKHKFNTFEEIRDSILAFKENPRIHNEKMTDENVKYWQKQTYKIQKVVTTTIDIVII